jgi:CDP-diacylglycerol--glycerol-3-phosphate 3-phosphatidyltransferase
MTHLEAAPKRNRALAGIAGGLTLLRFAAVVPFVVLLGDVAHGGSAAAHVALVMLFAAVAASDFFDGRLARRGGAETLLGARADAAADIVFNFASLSAGAWLRLIGPWVAAGMLVLGCRFLVRIRSAETVAGTARRKDAVGNLAGVLYYVLVGWMVAEVALGGVLGRRALAFGGDAVFLYTLVALYSARARPMSSRRA